MISQVLREMMMIAMTQNVYQKSMEQGLQLDHILKISKADQI